MFRTGLKGFFSILFGIIAIGALVAISMYALNYAESSGEDSTCETENCIGGETDTNGQEAINLNGDYLYLYNID